jgi:hypothetical protein
VPDSELPNIGSSRTAALPPETASACQKWRDNVKERGCPAAVAEPIRWAGIESASKPRVSEDMTKQINRDQLLKDIRTEWSRLEKSLSALTEEEMTKPGIVGAWSIKDILAHLAAWEQLLLDWYQAGIQGRTPAKAPVGMSRKAMDALNQEIYERNRQRSLDDVLTCFRTSYQQVLATIEAIPNDDIFAHGKFAWTGRLTLADYITGNTCNHYAWARAQILKQISHEKG